MNRRNFLLLSSAAGVALVGGGAAFVATDDYHAWVSRILHRGLPGYALEPEGFALFIKERFRHKDRKRRLFAAAEGVVDLKSVLPARTARKVADEEREILTDFLIGSDFFQNYPGGPKDVTFLGKPSACVSPFARF